MLLVCIQCGNTADFISKSYTSTSVLCCGQRMAPQIRVATYPTHAKMHLVSEGCPDCPYCKCEGGTRVPPQGGSGTAPPAAKPARLLESLENYNKRKRVERKTTEEAKRKTGIACPNCGKELLWGQGDGWLGCPDCKCKQEKEIFWFLFLAFAFTFIALVLFWYALS